MKILVTGSAGFIGLHLAKSLVNLGHDVVGIDNINDYYAVELKLSRLECLGISKRDALSSQIVVSSKYDNFKFLKLELEDRDAVNQLFSVEKFDVVCHLAAQAGVRYSIEKPHAYIDSNVVGFVNILEACRHNPVKKMLYASSSSVYGNSSKVPFSETDNVDTPISLYAATKKSNELMAHTYSHLFNIPTIGLRFFTVYGPWGRPDMAYYKFTKAILKGESFDVYNNGDLERDFTYIDDVIDGILALIKIDAEGYQLFNIGNNNPTRLLDFIETIELALGQKAKCKFLPMQDGDVYRTYADISKLHNYCGFNPSTLLSVGIGNFVKWYNAYNTVR